MMTPPDGGELQFDSVVPRAESAAAPTSRQCILCRATFESEYFDVNGQHICRACSEKVAHHAATPRGIGVLARAAGAGVVAAILGAVLYFAVLAISGFEVGLVAIAIGYMVGYGVRIGTRGRGGRRFQVLALLLTYWAIGLAYSSLALKEMITPRTQDASAAISGPKSDDAVRPVAPDAPSSGAGSTLNEERGSMTGGRFLLGLLQLLAFTFVLPVLVNVGSLPGGLISAAIIGFGMMQAWKMTAAPVLTVSGPYRIGTTPAAG
jgi:hypothetical protein